MDLSSASLNSAIALREKIQVNKIKLNYHPRQNIFKSIQLPGSKSESNRWLILQQFFPKIKLQNLANSVDTQVLQKALGSDSSTVNIGHAGTAMRFLTAYFASQTNQIKTLSGSARMHQRPIGDLVDALRQLGAKIEYLENDNFPPLKIYGRQLTGKNIKINADQSSQFISALLLISPSLKNDFTIEFSTKPTSKTYIQHTLSLLSEIGYAFDFTTDHLVVKQPFSFKVPQLFNIESDWSAASYLFSWIALSKNDQLKLKVLKENSFQADQVLPDIYSKFCVNTQRKGDELHLKKTNQQLPDEITLDLNNNPDIAQTLAVTCLGLGIDCYLTGLHTLTIKETNRLQAMKNELEKFNAFVTITKETLNLKSPNVLPDKTVFISTYDDHRMAMAFSPLVLKTDLIIENPKVVEKSYPDFWKDLEQLGLQSIDN